MVKTLNASENLFAEHDLIDVVYCIDEHYIILRRV